MPSPASKPTPGEVQGWSIDPGTVELVGLKFNRIDLLEGVSEAPDEPVNIDFEFSANRVGSNHLAVVLEVKVYAPGTLEVNVQAGTVLTVEHPEEPAEVVDEEYAKIAAQIGPVILYPYVRELIADLSRRTGKGTLTLPIYQVGTIFEVRPEEVRLREEPAPEKPAKKSVSKAKKPAKRTKAKS